MDHEFKPRSMTCRGHPGCPILFSTGGGCGVDPRCLTVHLGCPSSLRANGGTNTSTGQPQGRPAMAGRPGKNRKPRHGRRGGTSGGSGVWGCWWRRKLKDDVDTPFARGSRCRIGTFARNGPRLCAMGWHSRSATPVIVCVGGRLNLYSGRLAGDELPAVPAAGVSTRSREVWVPVMPACNSGRLRDLAGARSEHQGGTVCALLRAAQHCAKARNTLSGAAHSRPDTTTGGSIPVELTPRL